MPTKLNPYEQAAFEVWRETLPINLRNEEDYDLKGYWKKNRQASISGNLHLSDEFKLPNHPTFSNESIYYNPITSLQGGTWVETDSSYNYQPNSNLKQPIIEKKKLGGSMKKNCKYDDGGYKTISRKRNKISVTEEIPVNPSGTFIPQMPMGDHAFTGIPSMMPGIPLPKRPQAVTFEKSYTPNYWKETEEFYDMQGNKINRPTQVNYYPQDYVTPVYPTGWSPFEQDSFSASLPPKMSGIPVALEKGGYYVGYDGKRHKAKGSGTWNGSSYFEDGGIHIDPSKKGTFTAAATKNNMGVQEFASHVLANKDKYSPTMIKKANFAKNASKWNHEVGGTSQLGNISNAIDMGINMFGAATSMFSNYNKQQEYNEFMRNQANNGMYNNTTPNFKGNLPFNYGGLKKAGKGLNISGVPSIDAIIDAGAPAAPVRPTSVSNTNYTPTVNPKVPDSAQGAYQYYVSKGLDPHMAAGIVGNLVQESGLNPNAVNKKSGAFGAAQWLGARKRNFFNWATQNQLNPYDLYTQLDYVLTEPQESQRMLSALKATRTPEQASQVFADVYERMGKNEANYARRAGVAKKLYNTNYYELGGTYELTAEEIQNIINQGGDVEYL